MRHSVERMIDSNGVNNMEAACPDIKLHGLSRLIDSAQLEAARRRLGLCGSVSEPLGEKTTPENLKGEGG